MRGMRTRSTPMPRTTTPPSHLREERANESGEILRDGLHPLDLGALDHHAGERLRAGVADEHAPARSHLGLYGLDTLRERAQGFEGWLALDGHVEQHLGELAHAAGERGQGLAR